MGLLRFSFHNHKIRLLAKELNLKYNEVCAFDLVAGYTCPAADVCQSFADRESGKIKDGDNCQFRCYAASTESVFPTVRKMRWYNYETLKKLTGNEMTDLILKSLPKQIKVIRIHSAGDFFTKRYFLAWLEVAKQRPDIKFFGYTKILPYVRADKPDNFHLVYSFGGKMDKHIKADPVCYVVKSIAEALQHSVFIACSNGNQSDDFYRIMRGESFALMIHGTQPAKRKA